MFSLLRLLTAYCVYKCEKRADETMQVLLAHKSPAVPPVTEEAIARLEKALELEVSEEGDRT